MSSQTIPQNVAIIMDGNGRWAQLRNKPRSYGHIRGTRVAKDIITHCADLGVKSLTLYAFSTENWMRPQNEVSLLMTVLKKYLKNETQNLVSKNIKFSTIGEENFLPKDVLASIKAAKNATANCDGLHLVFAISYGSKKEITNSVKKIVELALTNKISLQDVTEETISQFLQTQPSEDPDLIIRTSGELRLSNFLLWQAAYSEFYFTNTLWPDFTKANLNEAFLNYQNRQRRFGKVLTNHDQPSN